MMTMVEPREGAVCNSCFLGCEAKRGNGKWVFPCGEQMRRFAEMQRAADYDQGEIRRLRDELESGGNQRKPHAGR